MTTIAYLDCVGGLAGDTLLAALLDAGASHDVLHDAARALGVERVVCSPIPYARGLIDTRHGTIPGPGPAVLALLGGALLTGVDAESELVTPTGAAIVATVATSFGELPPMRLDAVGYGAGSRDLRLP